MTDNYWQLPKLEQNDVEKVTALDKGQMAYVQLDAHGTLYGWTMEQFGWEHMKLADKGLLL